MDEKVSGESSEQTVFQVPRGRNPYFPDEPAKAAAVPTEDTDATDPDASETGQPGVVEAAAEEPTFDVETDRQRGIDVNDPSYKHFQAAFTRATQKRAAAERERDRRETEGGKDRTQEAVEKTTTEPEQPSAIKLTFEGFQAPRLPETAQLAGIEDEVVEIVKAVAQAAVNDIARQQQAFVQQQSQMQVRTKIETFINEIEASSPESASKAISLLERYAAVAKSDPDAFIDLAKIKLGLNGDPPPRASEPEPARQTPTPQRLAEKQRSAVPRPTTNGTTARTGPDLSGLNAKEATRRAIAHALDQQGV